MNDIVALVQYLPGLTNRESEATRIEARNIGVERERRNRSLRARMRRLVGEVNSGSQKADEW